MYIGYFFSETGKSSRKIYFGSMPEVLMQLVPFQEIAPRILVTDADDARVLEFVNGQMTFAVTEKLSSWTKEVLPMGTGPNLRAMSGNDIVNYSFCGV